MLLPPKNDGISVMRFLCPGNWSNEAQRIRNIWCERPVPKMLLHLKNGGTSGSYFQYSVNLNCDVQMIRNIWYAQPVPRMLPHPKIGVTSEPCFRCFVNSSNAVLLRVLTAGCAEPVVFVALAAAVSGAAKLDGARFFDLSRYCRRSFYYPLQSRRWQLLKKR